jgi:hypothetical protein
LVLTFFLCLGIAFLLVARLFKDSSFLKTMILLLVFLVFIFSTSAWGNFNNTCYSKISDDYSDLTDYTLSIGPGFGAAVAAWFFMSFIVSTLNILIVSTGSTDQASLNEPLPYASPNPVIGIHGEVSPGQNKA